MKFSPQFHYIYTVVIPESNTGEEDWRLTSGRDHVSRRVQNWRNENRGVVFTLNS